MTHGTSLGCHLEIPRPERTPFEPGDPDETAIIDGGDVIPVLGIVVSSMRLAWSSVSSHTAIGTQVGGP